MSNLSASSTNANIYNVCSLEHCYTNLFALTDLTGIKWLRLRAKDAAEAKSGARRKRNRLKRRLNNDDDDDEDDDDEDDDDDDESSDDSDSDSASSDSNRNAAQSTPKQASSSQPTGGAGASSLLTSSASDPVLATHAKCLKEDILSSWKRVSVAKPGAGGGKASPGASGQSQFRKELWIFWYEREEPANLKSIISPDLIEETSSSCGGGGAGSSSQTRHASDSGGQSITAAASSSTNGLPYECRSMLFKALHHLIEKCLIEKGYARLGKWFVMPYNHVSTVAPVEHLLGSGAGAFINGEFSYAHQQASSSNGKALADDNHHVSYSFSFFLHGASRVCTSVDIKLHKPIRTLNINDLIRLKRLISQASFAQSNRPAAAELEDAAETTTTGSSQKIPGISVILAPYGVAARLVGYVHNESAEARQTCQEWRQFYPLKLTAHLPHVFIVLVENNRYKLFYPNSFVYVVMDEDSSSSSSSDESGESEQEACDDEDDLASPSKGSAGKSRTGKGGRAQTAKESDSKEMDSLDYTIFMVARAFGNDDDAAPATTSKSPQRSSLVQSPASPSMQSINSKLATNSPKVPASPLAAAGDQLMSPSGAANSRRRSSINSPFKTAAAAAGANPAPVAASANSLKRNKSSNLQSPGAQAAPPPLRPSLSLSGQADSSPTGKKKPLGQRKSTSGVETAAARTTPSKGGLASGAESQRLARLRRRRQNLLNRRARMKHVLMNIRKRIRRHSSASHSLATIIDLIDSSNSPASRAKSYIREQLRNKRRVDLKKLSFTSADFLKNLARKTEHYGRALNKCCRRFDFTMDNQIRLKHKQIELMHENAPLAFDVLDKCQLCACLACTCPNPAKACARCSVHRGSPTTSVSLHVSTQPAVCQCATIVRHGAGQPNGLEAKASPALPQLLPQAPAKIKSEPLIPQLTSFNTTSSTAAAVVETAASSGSVSVKNLNSAVHLQPFHHRQCYLDHDGLDDRSSGVCNGEHARVKMNKSVRLVKQSAAALLGKPETVTKNKVLKFRDNSFLAEENETAAVGSEAEAPLLALPAGYLSDDSVDWSDSFSRDSSDAEEPVDETTANTAGSETVNVNMNTKLSKRKPSSIQFFEHDDDDSLFEEDDEPAPTAADAKNDDADGKKLKKQMKKSLLGSSDDESADEAVSSSGSSAAGSASSDDDQETGSSDSEASSGSDTRGHENGVMNGGGLDEDSDDVAFIKAVKLIDKKSKRAKRSAAAAAAEPGLRLGVTSFYDDLYKPLYKKTDEEPSAVTRRPCLTNLTNKAAFASKSSAAPPAATTAAASDSNGCVIVLDGESTAPAAKEESDESGNEFSSLYNADYKQQIYSLVTASGDLLAAGRLSDGLLAKSVPEDPYEFDAGDDHGGRATVSSATMANSISLAAKSQMTPPKSVESLQPPLSNNPGAAHDPKTFNAAPGAAASATGAYFSSSLSTHMPPANYNDLENLFEEESSSLSADEQHQNQQLAAQDGGPALVNGSGIGSGGSGGGQSGFKPNGVPTPTPPCISVVMTPPSHENIALYSQVASVGAASCNLATVNELSSNADDLSNDFRWSLLGTDEKDPDYLQTRLTKLNDYSTLMSNQKRSSFNEMLENTFELVPVAARAVELSKAEAKALANKYKPVNMAKLERALSTISAAEVDYDYEIELLKEEFAAGASKTAATAVVKGAVASRRQRQKLVVNFLKEKITGAKSRLRWSGQKRKAADDKRSRFLMLAESSSPQAKAKLAEQTTLTCLSNDSYIHVSVVKKQGAAARLPAVKDELTNAAQSLALGRPATVDSPQSVKKALANGPTSVGSVGMMMMAASPSVMSQPSALQLQRANSVYPPPPKTPLSQQQQQQQSVASPYYGVGGQFGLHGSSNVPTPSQGGPSSVGPPPLSVSQQSNHPASYMASGVGSVGGAGNLSMEQSFSAESPSMMRGAGGPMSNKPAVQSNGGMLGNPASLPPVKSTKSLPMPAVPAAATASATTAATSSKKQQSLVEAKRLELAQRSYLLSSAASCTTDAKQFLSLNGLCLNMNLSDTLLNVYRDINFDSCTLCVCSNSNIHGVDYSVYICNDIFDMDEAAKLANFAAPYAANGGAAPGSNLNSSALHASNMNSSVAQQAAQHHQCTCGFSSIVNRQLFSSTATIVRISDLVNAYARQAGVDPAAVFSVLTTNTGGPAPLGAPKTTTGKGSKAASSALASQASLVDFKTRLFRLFNLNTNTFNRNYLVLLNDNSCNGVFFEDYVDALSVIQPAASAAHAYLFPTRSQSYEYYLNACLLIRDNYLLKPNFNTFRWRQLAGLGASAATTVTTPTGAEPGSAKKQQPPKRQQSQSSLGRSEEESSSSTSAASSAPSNSILDLLDVRYACPFLSVQESFDLFYMNSRRTGDCNTAGFVDLELEQQIEADERDVARNALQDASSTEPGKTLTGTNSTSTVAAHKRKRRSGSSQTSQRLEKYKLNVLDENNVCSNVIKRLASATKTKLAGEVGKQTTTTSPAQGTPPEVLHRWLWSKKEIRSNLELSKSLKLIQPLLEETVQKKYTTSRMWESFQGPLTWQHFCRLAFRDSDSRSGPSASGSGSAGAGSAGSSSGGGGQNQNSYEPEPIPALLVSSSDRDWLAVSPYAIKFWDKLNLEPYSKQKNVAYIVLYPDFGNEESAGNIKQEQDSSDDAAGLGNSGDQFPNILQSVKEYFRELTSMYELCRLGIHRPALRIAPDQGFVRVPFTSIHSAASSAKKPATTAAAASGVSVDAWFSEIESNSVTEKIGTNLKSLAVTLKSLAVKISTGYLGPSSSILTHLATYNPTSAASTLASGPTTASTTAASFSTPHVQSTIPLISLDRTLFEEVRPRFEDAATAAAAAASSSAANDLSSGIGDPHHHHHHHHISPMDQQTHQQAQILNIGGGSSSSANHSSLNDLDVSQHQQQQQQRASQSAITQLTAHMTTSPALIVYIVDPFDYYLYALKSRRAAASNGARSEPSNKATAESEERASGEERSAGDEAKDEAAASAAAAGDEEYQFFASLNEEDLKRLRQLGIYKAYLEFYNQLPDIFKYSTQFQIVPLNMIADIQQQSTSMYLQALMQNQTCGANFSSCFGSGMGTGWSDLDMDYKLSLFKAQAFNVFALSKRHFMTPAHNFYLNIQQQHNSFMYHHRAKSLTGLGPAATEERFLRDNLLSFGLGGGGASHIGGQVALPAASKSWTFAQIKKVTFYSPPFILAPSTLSTSAMAAMASNLFFKSAGGGATESTNKLMQQTSTVASESSALLSNFIHLNLSNSNYGFLNTAAGAGSSSAASSGVVGPSSEQQQQCNVLYVSYCLSEDQRYLLTCCCDENGELLESTSINIEVDERMRRREAHARRLALRKLWEFIIVIISQTCKPWRLVIGRLGRMGHSELRGWGCLISKKNLQRVCQQIKESCDTCQTLGQMEMPCILSACLISMETCENICIYPEAYSREDKSAAAALNGQQLLPNHAAQAHGISCTHILTFPASAVIQTQSASMMMINNKDGDPLSKSGAMPMDDDFLSLFNIDKLEDEDIGDLLNGDGHNKPCFNESGMAMECETNVNLRDKIESLLNQEEMPHLDQQPLAVGYYVSTAKCGMPLPSWLRSGASLNTNFHTFKATLHIHNRYALEDDELSVQGKTEYSHKLDSSVTYEVLRYVLEKYNALSWLNVDPVMQDRKSCLPINHVLLLQMYYAFRNYV